MRRRIATAATIAALMAGTAAAIAVGSTTTGQPSGSAAQGQYCPPHSPNPNQPPPCGKQK